MRVPNKPKPALSAASNSIAPTRSHPALLSESFCDTLDSLGPFEPRPHIAIAVSGGSDSMALLLLAQHWAQQQRGTLTALTVDHRLREASTHEAQHVAHWCEARGIAHHILTPEHIHASNNLQAAARSWRYRALTDWCNAQHILHLLVGHHQGDLIETHLLLQTRGATQDGAASMPRVRMMHGVRLLRPLLGITRSELRDYLAAAHQDFIEDPSNNDTRFARVRLRQQLGTSNDTDTHHSLQRIAHAADQRAAHETTLAEAAYRIVTWHVGNDVRMDAEAFYALDPELATTLLANLLRSLSGRSSRPRQHETMYLYETLRTESAKATLAGAIIVRRGANIHFMREHAQRAGAAAPLLPLAASPFWA
jgi:tRNA(Ile)-lysidine synthase